MDIHVCKGGRPWKRECRREFTFRRVCLDVSRVSAFENLQCSGIHVSESQRKMMDIEFGNLCDKNIIMACGGGWGKRGGHDFVFCFQVKTESNVCGRVYTVSGQLSGNVDC